MNTDRALRRYYGALKGSTRRPVWHTVGWVLTGPVAVALMLLVVAGLPSGAGVRAGDFLLRKQAQMLGLASDGKDRDRLPSRKPFALRGCARVACADGRKIV